MNTRFSPFRQDLIDLLNAGNFLRDCYGINDVDRPPRGHATQLYVVVAHPMFLNEQTVLWRTDSIEKIGKDSARNFTTIEPGAARREGEEDRRGSGEESCGLAFAEISDQVFHCADARVFRRAVGDLEQRVIRNVGSLGNFLQQFFFARSWQTRLDVLQEARFHVDA